MAKSYLMLEGKKVILSDETVKNLKNELGVEKGFELWKLSLNPFSSDANIIMPDKWLNAGFDNPAIQIRAMGEYVGKAFYLSSNYDWAIKEDKTGSSPKSLLLVPTRKK